MNNGANMSFKPVNEYYVYAYYDPRNGDAIYIGLGKKKRAFVHWKEGAANRMFNNVLNKIRTAGLTPRIEFVAMELSLDDAKNLERQLIALYGRRDLGLGRLCNQTEGGDGAEGHIRSETALAGTKAGIASFWANVDRVEHGKKISQTFASRTPEELKIVGDNIRKSRTKEVQDRITAAVIERQSTVEWKAWKSAQIQTPETRAKRSASMKNTLASQEKREAKSRIARELWATPEYRDSVLKGRQLRKTEREAQSFLNLSGSSHKEN